MKFILDNNLPPRAARVLDALYEPEGHRIFHLRDRFEAKTPDEEWLVELGEEGDRLVVTKDRNIKKNKQQRALWRRSGLTVFFLKKGWELPVLELCRSLIWQWDEILRRAESRRGCGYLVPLRGKKLEEIHF